MIWSCLAAFVFGAAVDFLTILFYYAVERVDVRRATGWSMAMGAAGMLGISEALHSWPAKAALIAGYGAGTYWTMRAKKAALAQEMENER